MARIDKNKALQAAHKHLAKGNLRKALEEYSKILRQDPRNDNIRLKSAELLERLGETARAAEEYRRVARGFKAGGFYTKACALLSRVASLEPESASAHLELAELNQKMGRVAEALRHYQLATDVQGRGRDKRHSIDILKRIAEVGVPNLDRNLEVACLYYKEGFEQEGFEQFCHATDEMDRDSDELLEITLRMCRAQPGDTRLKGRLGELRLARRETKEAIGLFDELVAASRDARNLSLLAEARLQDHQLEEARALFEEAIEMYEADRDLERRRELSARLLEIKDARLDSTLGKTAPVPEAAAPEGPCSGAVGTETDDLGTLIAEAEALLRNGKRSDAVQTLESASARHPRQLAPLLRLRAIYEESADWSPLSALNLRIANATDLLAGDGNDPEPASGPARTEACRENPRVPREADRPLVAHGSAADPVTPDVAMEFRAGDLDIQIVIEDKELRGSGTGGGTSSSAEQAARDAGLRSALTGLPIRDLFMDRVDRAIMRGERFPSYLFAVLVLDIDRFKRVNDGFGLARGDELLVSVAKRLEKCLRKTDTAAYLGGDEFGILLENIRGARDALSLARKIGRRLTSPFELDGQEVNITASIGIAMSSTGYSRPEAALKDAEAAMFRAKRGGRGLAEIFDESLRSRATAILQLETDLRRAVEAGGFLIHYQPVVSLVTGLVTGFEALARWRHPGGNLIAPDDFIPMAEEIALIGPIEKWLVAEACRRLREWQGSNPEGQPLTMSVNVSGKHLADCDFIAHLEAALSESAIEPGTLVLEVTESALVENAEILPPLFARLEELQVRLCVDDFGAGVSSLPLLERHPFAALKIDAAATGEGTGLVRFLLRLAEILGADPIAKGVENDAQLADLRELGCEFAQGHIFSPALEAGKAGALIGKSLPR